MCICLAWTCVVLTFVSSGLGWVQQWKHNRFDAYKPNTNDTAIRNLPPGTNGDAATVQMLQAINNDKEEVTALCNQRCVALWLDAADLCNLTYECPYNPNTRLSCRKPSDIGLAWKQCAGPANCKRIAFIFDYYGPEVHRRALNMTHQEATTKHVTETMGVVMDVQPSEMRRGQKTCIQQQYSLCAKNNKNNILRVGGRHHHVRVNLEKGKAAKTNKNWKRPKEVFFNSRINSGAPSGARVVDEVSAIRACAGGHEHEVHILAHLHASIQVDYSMDDQWNLWVKLGVQKLVALDGAMQRFAAQASNLVALTPRPTFASPMELGGNTGRFAAQASNHLVARNPSPTVTSPSPVTRPRPSPVRVAALEDTIHAWSVHIDEGGGGRLGSMEWNNVATATQVSN